MLVALFFRTDLFRSPSILFQSWAFSYSDAVFLKSTRKVNPPRYRHMTTRKVSIGHEQERCSDIALLLVWIRIISFSMLSKELLLGECIKFRHFISAFIKREADIKIRTSPHWNKEHSFKFFSSPKFPWSSMITFVTLT